MPEVLSHLAKFLVRLYGLVRLSKQHMFSVRKAGYRNMTLDVIAVTDDKRLPEETVSTCLEYEQVWNLVEARIANSTAKNLNSTYTCSGLKWHELICFT